MDIDIVLPWVDGNDQEWQREKRKFQGISDNENTALNRYRDWGLLPFWFRMIENYTPWVRRVYFVTWGHVPAFLNTENSKLHIVNHNEFIPSEYLPTFSSHAIEMNIHRIPGLADHFIYFNDDTFLLKYHAPDDFFKDGLPCSYGGEVPIWFNGKIGTWQHAAVNDLGVINKHFPKKQAVKQYGDKFRSKVYRGKDNLRTFALEKLYPDYFTGFKNLHAPAAYIKNTFEQVWNAEYEVLDATCRHRFRTSDDVNQWVFLWWQVAGGQFTPSNIDNFVGLITPDTINYFCRIIENQSHMQICLNDPDEEVPFDELAERLQESFAKILPKKSEFEL